MFCRYQNDAFVDCDCCSVGVKCFADFVTRTHRQPGPRNSAPDVVDQSAAVEHQPLQVMEWAATVDGEGVRVSDQSAAHAGRTQLHSTDGLPTVQETAQGSFQTGSSV